jgi:predicted lactoylglutathione lyase
MKIKTTVLCLPVTDLKNTLNFYKGAFGFSDAKIEEGIISLELPHMTLFLMEKGNFESYTTRANRAALLPGASAPAVISCAVETKQDVDDALEQAIEHGGAAPGAPEIDPSFGGYIGYVSDPDGHLWELVWPKQE